MKSVRKSTRIQQLIEALHGDRQIEKIEKGLNVIFYESGVIKTRTHWKAWKKDGLEEFFNLDGKLIRSTMWMNGMKHGSERLFDLDGRIYRDIFYLNDESVESLDYNWKSW